MDYWAKKMLKFTIESDMYFFSTPLSDVDRPGEIETMISVLPLFHVYGIYACTLYTFFKGNTSVVMSPFDPTAYLKLIQDYKVGL